MVDVRRRVRMLALRVRVRMVVEHVNEGDKVGGGKKMMIVGERMLGMRERVIVLWVYQRG